VQIVTGWKSLYNEDIRTEREDTFSNGNFIYLIGHIDCLADLLNHFWFDQTVFEIFLDYTGHCSDCGGLQRNITVRPDRMIRSIGSNRMKKMKRKKLAAIGISGALAVSMLCLPAAPAQAAAKKTLYLPDKITRKMYHSGKTYTVTYRYDYTKTGILKKSVISIPSLNASVTLTYRCNSRKQIVRASERTRFVKSSDITGVYRYQYNRAGYVIRRKSYDSSGAYAGRVNYGYNRKHQLISERQYNARGRLQQKTVYRCDARGNYTGYRDYDASGKVTDVGVIRSVIRSGRVRSSKEYVNGKKVSVQTYHYKKFRLSGSSYKTAKRQLNSSLAYLI
jgi:hypothetical protein